MEYQFNNKNTKVQQLADLIKDAISINEIKAGDKLPSINSLSRKYSISRDTVFKAFLQLKEKGIIDSIHGKNYYVRNQFTDVFLLLDEYSPFKEAFYKSLRDKLPLNYKVDLWFHQYNQQLFNTIIDEAAGRYNKYLVMNYHNEQFSEKLRKIEKERLLLLDFGKFDKEEYSYICQDFDEGLYDALSSIKNDLKKYSKLIFVIYKTHKHPKSSKDFFKKFCEDNQFECQILDEVSDEMKIEKNHFYLVIKHDDVVNLIKKGKAEGLKTGKDFGLLAYNENPFFEVVEDGISGISVDFKLMGNIAADFVLKNRKTQITLPTEVNKRNSF